MTSAANHFYVALKIFCPESQTSECEALESRILKANIIRYCCCH